MMLERGAGHVGGGCGSRAEGVRVTCKGGCGSNVAWPPPNTHRRRGLPVATLIQPYTNVASIKSVKPINDLIHECTDLRPQSALYTTITTDINYSSRCYL